MRDYTRSSCRNLITKRMRSLQTSIRLSRILEIFLVSFISVSTHVDQHLNKFLTKQADLSEAERSEYFVYVLLKLAKDEVLIGKIPNLILNEPITDYQEISELCNVAIDPSKLPEEAKVVSVIKKYDPKFEEAHKAEIISILLYSLQSYISRFYEKNLDKVTKYNKIKSCIESMLKYYRNRKHTSKKEAAVVDQYSFLGERILEVMQALNIFSTVDKKLEYNTVIIKQLQGEFKASSKELATFIEPFLVRKV